MRVTDNSFRPVTISADGRRVVFNAVLERQSQLFSRSIDSLDAQPISGTENASRTHTLSPDGQWIAFIDQSDSMLKKVPVTGGISVTLCDPAGTVWSMAWGASGDIVYVTETYAGLMRVSSSGGLPEEMTSPDPDEFHKQPNFSLDGNTLLFTIGERGTTTRKSDRLRALSLATGEQKVLMAGAAAKDLPDGYLVYFELNALWAVEFDADRLEVTGRR